MNTMPNLVRPAALARRARSLRTWSASTSAIWLLATGAAMAQAASPPATPEVRNEESQELRVGKGDATRSWLGAQASRKQASSTRQTLSGSAMSTVNRRYVESFSHEIERTPIRADMPNSNR